jgi:1-deoxy-D-xylulose-5-phosphate synthase
MDIKKATGSKRLAARYPLLARYGDGKVARLDIPALPALCREIRAFLIEHISKNGGHFASNLGVVELTVALHYCFSLDHDRLFFDVGHQCYPHKLLTGRMEQFSTLRREDGLSGFPKPSESAYDAFIAGHASAAISVALGSARAARLQGNLQHTIVMIGDGSLTGGMAYEALNDAGGSGERLIVILNDNGMSIDRSVGGLAKKLTALRMKGPYRRAKVRYHRFMDRLPVLGAEIDRVLTDMKNSLKHAILPGSFFESMGFTYIGPVDGHNIKELCTILEETKTYDKPVLIHALTKKGKGYSHSETRPKEFHGVSSFHVPSGICQKSSEKTFTNAFSAAITRLAEENPKIAAITAAMPEGTGLACFKKRFPERFFDVGITEGHAVAMAAGLAKGGMRPVVAIYSTFLQRAYDQLLHDVGILGLPVTFCIDRAGFVGEDGETHQGLYDMAMLTAVPGMQVFAPSNEAELTDMLRKAVSINGPTALRYPRGNLPAFSANTAEKDAVRIFPENAKSAAEKPDVSIITYGRTVDAALSAAKKLQKAGVRADVWKCNRLWPVPINEMQPELAENILVCEENAATGSIGLFISAALTGTKHNVVCQNCGNTYVVQGSVSQQQARYGLDAEGIWKAAIKLAAKPDRRTACESIT